MSEPTKHDDLIDSRYLIEYIDELVSERDDLREAISDSETSEEREQAEAALAEWEAENLKDLESVEAFAEDCENCADDWVHGVALIAESYFQEYAKQLAEDIGAVDRDAPWPLSRIDWDAAADDLKQDYTAVEWDDCTFFVR